jgi:hypothetical protein
MVVFVVLSTLLQLFSIYLDFRQKAQYKNQTLPVDFEHGFQLSDDIDRRMQKGFYDPERSMEERKQAYLDNDSDT